MAALLGLVTAVLAALPFAWAEGLRTAPTAAEARAVDEVLPSLVADEPFRDSAPRTVHLRLGRAFAGAPLLLWVDGGEVTAPGSPLAGAVQVRKRGGRLEIECAPPARCRDVVAVADHDVFRLAVGARRLLAAWRVRAAAGLALAGVGVLVLARPMTARGAVMRLGAMAVLLAAAVANGFWRAESPATWAALAAAVAFGPLPLLAPWPRHAGPVLALAGVAALLAFGPALAADNAFLGTSDDFPHLQAVRDGLRAVDLLRAYDEHVTPVLRVVYVVFWSSFGWWWTPYGVFALALHASYCAAAGLLLRDAGLALPTAVLVSCALALAPALANALLFHFAPGLAGIIAVAYLVAALGAWRFVLQGGRSCLALAGGLVLVAVFTAAQGLFAAVVAAVFAAAAVRAADAGPPRVEARARAVRLAAVVAAALAVYAATVGVGVVAFGNRPPSAWSAAGRATYERAASATPLAVRAANVVAFGAVGWLVPAGGSEADEGVPAHVVAHRWPIVAAVGLAGLFLGWRGRRGGREARAALVGLASVVVAVAFAVGVVEARSHIALWAMRYNVGATVFLAVAAACLLAEAGRLRRLAERAGGLVAAAALAFALESSALAAGSQLRQREALGAGLRGAQARLCDFDGDWEPDLLVSGPPGVATFHPGRPARRTPSWTLAHGDEPIGCGDLDRDRLAELLVRRADGVVVAVWPDGRSATAAVPPRADVVPRAVLDVDRDGRLDLVWQDANAQDTWRTPLDGRSAGQPWAVLPPGARALAAGDVDRDGILDILWSDAAGTGVTSLGEGGPRHHRLDLPLGGLDVVGVTDLDRDGFPEVVTAGRGSLAIFHGQGPASSWERREYLPPPGRVLGPR